MLAAAQKTYIGDQMMTRAQGRYSRLGGKVGLTLYLTLFFSFGAFATEFIIKLKPNKDLKQQISIFNKNANVTVFDQHEIGRLVGVEIADTKAAAITLKELSALAAVEYIVPNIKMKAFGEPDDPKFSEQWALAKVNAAAAWDITTGSENVVVAVIDTGISTSHEDITENLWVNADEIAGNGIDDDGNGFVDDMNGWDFRDNDNNPDDLTSERNPGHGTHCAGIVGAVGNNTKGISGINQSVSLMAVRFLGADGSGDLLSGAKAIDYAVQNGAQVISASWGAAVQQAQAQPIIDAIGRANDQGVVFVAAAANDGTNNDSRSVYPANTALPNVISVAASANDDSKPAWSNFGKAKVHLASPGLDILSTLPGNKYATLSGTSNGYAVSCWTFGFATVGVGRTN